MNNYFETLQLEINFTINQIKLNQQYHNLIKMNHPDRFTQANPDLQTQALNNTSIINEAYLCLKNPLTRAKHILELNKNEFQEQKNITNTKFLFDQMQLHEQIEALNQTGKIGEIDKFKAEVTQKYEEQLSQLSKNLQQKDWLQAEQNLLQANMLNNIQKKLAIMYNKTQETVTE